MGGKDAALNSARYGGSCALLRQNLSSAATELTQPAKCSQRISARRAAIYRYRGGEPPPTIGGSRTPATQNRLCGIVTAYTVVSVKARKGARMSSQIDHLLNEDRRFAPPAAFTANAVATADLYTAAAADREAFWAEQARALHWHTPFTQVLDWTNPPFAQWFADGEINVAYNCLDRHVEAGLGDRVALLWEGEPGDERRVTYAELTDEVKRVANVLGDLGIGHGDRVAIYMPMIPEAIAAMLAVARVGAIHSVIFGGFSADSLRTRIDDAGAKLVITADGGYRKGRVSPLKPAVDQALGDRGAGVQETVEHVLVVQRTGNAVGWDDRPRSLVARRGARGIRRARRAALPRREPAVHPLHVGDDGKAQGHPAHLRRLPDPGGLHQQGGARPAPRERRLLVHGRHRLDHGPLLRRPTVRSPTAPPRCSTKAPRTRRTPAAGGRSWRSTASRSSTRRRRRSARS